MIRVEVVANHSVEENVLDAFKHEGVGKYYTKYPTVYGVGTSGPKMGDAIWPEENFALVIWCDEKEAHGISEAIKFVKKKFPDEGIKVFGLPETETEPPEAEAQPPKAETVPPETEAQFPKTEAVPPETEK